MAQIKNPLAGGGGAGGSLDVVNGIIEQYKAASGTIDANTFVEFVRDWSGIDPSNNEEQISDIKYTGYRISAVKLDGDKIFIAHTYGGSDSSAYLYGVVCVVENDKITHGTDTMLVSEAGVYGIDAAVLNDGRVFVAWTKSTPNATIVAADGMTVVSGTKYTLNTSTLSSPSISITPVSGGIFVLYGISSGSSYNTYGIVSRVNESIITSGTRASMIGYMPSGGCGLVTYNETNVLYGHQQSTNYTSGDFGVSTASIAGTTITRGAHVSINSVSGYYGAAQDLCLVSDSLAMLSFGDNTASSARLFALLVSISGTTPTAGTTVQINAQSGTGGVSPHGTALVEENKVCILAGDSAISCYLAEINPDDNTFSIDASATVAIGGQVMKSLLLNSHELAVAYKYGSTNTTSFLFCTTIASGGDPLTVTIPTGGVDGLTATACTADTPGDVWVLNASSTTTN